MLHNTLYDFNDEILPLGASYWVELVKANNATNHLEKAAWQYAPYALVLFLNLVFSFLGMS